MFFIPKFYQSKIRLALFFLALLIALGVCGFRLIADYSWIDAFYMTAITITTVGFGEVTPLEPEAKLFTIFLIINSVVVLGYTVTVTTEYILSQNNFERLKILLKSHFESTLKFKILNFTLNLENSFKKKLIFDFCD